MTDVTVHLPVDDPVDVVVRLGETPLVFPEDVSATVEVTGVTVVTGTGGSGGGIEYVQSAPSASWIIPVPVSMGRRPNVAVYILGNQVEADVSADSTTVSIAFPSPIAGTAVLT